MNALNHQWMMRGAAKPAALRKDWQAVAAVSVAFCDSFVGVPPHLVEAVFLCPVGARTSEGVAAACENAALVQSEKIIK